MTKTGAKASLRKVVTPQEPRSTTKTRRRHQPTMKKVALLRGSLRGEPAAYPSYLENPGRPTRPLPPERLLPARSKLVEAE